MKRFQVDQILSIGSAVTAIESLLHQAKNPDVSHPEIRAGVLEAFKGFQKEIEEAGLPMSLKAIEDLVRLLEISPEHGVSVRDSLFHLQRTLENETSMMLYMQILPDKVRYFEQPLKGWEDVVAKFPSTRSDIEEASRCLACERYTAAVFHLMKVLEPAFSAAGKALGIQIKSPTWNAYLQSFAKHYQAQFGGKTAADKDQLAFYSDLHANLLAIKDAWRNPTMHVVGLYTESAAFDIYNAVAGFMRKISRRLSE